MNTEAEAWESFIAQLDTGQRIELLTHMSQALTLSLGALCSMLGIPESIAAENADSLTLELMDEIL
ncbi:hypothetical protein [Rhodococcus sp. B10]|uniref:hypothetical protein n=1 Tax=Rhodococcus sp. B10 TaxID=2695876 RepID=UPI0014302A36|nr:hypothetical protein [Rhodococcus sp. B10]NIL77636.1 hypothetical protein [Rhodococcus sp. B10]